MAQTKYPNLIAPYKVTDKIILKNKMCGAHIPPLFSSSPNIYPDGRIREHYRWLAQNGAATITWDYSNDKEIKEQCLSILNADLPEDEKLTELPDTADVAHAGFGQWEYDNPLVQNQICLIVNEVHALGTKMIFDLNALMPTGYSYGGGPYWSQHPDLGGTVEYRPAATKEMLLQVKEEMVESCRMFKKLGFDGCSMNGNMSDFLCESVNVRTDEYGGSLKNRTRYYVEILEAIREAMGQEWIIEITLPPEAPHGTENRAKVGYKFEDSVEFVKSVEHLVSWWQVRYDNMTVQSPCGYTHEEEEYPTLSLCKRLKEAGVKVPLAANGGFQNPEAMEKALADGVCDLVAISRGFIADPQYYKKIKEGRAEDILPCLTCSNCQGIPTFPWLQVCALNPEYGLGVDTHVINRTPERLKNVAVIGGGPAGMRTAIMAAQKGHTVTLFEKTDYLGGQLSHADAYKFKWPLKRYRLWLIEQVKKAGVTIKMNHEPTPAEIATFDAAFACTGAVGVMPNIEGVDDPAIINAHAVWKRENEIGQKVVIVGGSELGVEAGIHLAQNGKDVTVLSRQPIMAHDASTLHSITMTWVKENEEGWPVMSPEWLKYDNFHGEVNATTTKVTPHSVTYIQNGEEHTIECDTVIVGGGAKATTDEVEKYAGTVSEFYMVGDCEGTCGNLRTVNRHVFIKVNEL